MHAQRRRLCETFLTLAVALLVSTSPTSAQDAEKGTDATDAQNKEAAKKVDLTPAPSDEALEAKCLSEVGEGFKIKHTRHYAVLYNTSEDSMKSFGSAIERTYRSCLNYCIKMNIPIEPPKTKLLIYYFQEHAQYNNHSKKIGMGEHPQSTPGFYSPDKNMSYFYNFQNQDSFKAARKSAEAKIASMQGKGKLSPEDRKAIAEARRVANSSSTQGGDISESIVQHEVTHQVLWNVGFHNPKSFFCNPRWFAEGTAMMFEPISSGGSANFGALNKERLKEYRIFEKRDRLIPLREFISTHQWFGPKSIDVAYAEAWAVVHYLNRTKRKDLARYVSILNKRSKDYETTPEKEIKTFEKCFGKIDEKWIRQWKEWMKNVH